MIVQVHQFCLKRLVRACRWRKEQSKRLTLIMFEVHTLCHVAQLLLTGEASGAANKFPGGARVLTRSTTWEVWWNKLPISTFVFATYLKSGGLNSAISAMRHGPPTWKLAFNTVTACLGTAIVAQRSVQYQTVRATGKTHYRRLRPGLRSRR